MEPLWQITTIKQTEIPIKTIQTAITYYAYKALELYR